MLVQSLVPSVGRNSYPKRNAESKGKAAFYLYYFKYFYFHSSHMAPGKLTFLPFHFLVPDESLLNSETLVVLCLLWRVLSRNFSIYHFPVGNLCRRHPSDVFWMEHFLVASTMLLNVIRLVSSSSSWDEGPLSQKGCRLWCRSRSCKVIRPESDPWTWVLHTSLHNLQEFWVWQPSLMIMHRLNVTFFRWNYQNFRVGLTQHTFRTGANLFEYQPFSLSKSALL